MKTIMIAFLFVTWCIVYAGQISVKSEEKTDTVGKKCPSCNGRRFVENSSYGSKRLVSQTVCERCKGRGKIYETHKVFYVVVNEKVFPIPKEADVSYDDMAYIYWIIQKEKSWEMPGGYICPKIGIHDNGELSLLLVGTFEMRGERLNLNKIHIRTKSGKNILFTPEEVIKKTKDYSDESSLYYMESFIGKLPSELIVDPPVKCRFIGESSTCDSVIKPEIISVSTDLLLLVKQIQETIKQDRINEMTSK